MRHIQIFEKFADVNKLWQEIGYREYLDKRDSFLSEFRITNTIESFISKYVYRVSIGYRYTLETNKIPYQYIFIKNPTKKIKNITIFGLLDDYYIIRKDECLGAYLCDTDDGVIQCLERILWDNF